jgi:hypothetical protein
MNKIYFNFLLIIMILAGFFSSLNAQSLVVGAPGNDYVLTCLNTPITMTANTGTTPHDYTWTVLGSTLTGNYANVTLPGTWTVAAQNLITLAITQQTFLITQNITAPSVTVAPLGINLPCNTAANSFTGTSNLGPNVTTNWYQVLGTNTAYVGVQQGTINVFQPSSTGVFWFESKNNLTGCSTTKSVEVSPSSGVPHFTVTSPTNFTLGCGTKSVSSMQVSMVLTTPMPNMPTDYFFAPPPGTLTPSFSPNPNQTNVITPGLWVVYVRDLMNLCISTKSISVIQNTVQPNAYILQPVSMLTCKDPTMNLTGVSNNLNPVYTWTVPALPSNSISPVATISVSSNSAIANSSVNLITIGVYTAGITDNNNNCSSTKTVQVIQDFRIPIFTLSALSNSILTCANPDVLLVAITTTAMASALMPTYAWQVPASTVITSGTTYNTQVPGVHTATATSITNGCTYTNTFNVGIGNAVAATDQTIVTTCNLGTVSISPNYPSGTAGLTFTWTGPAGAIVTPTNQSTVVGNALGNYTCVITNTVNGCTKTVTCMVICDSQVSESNLSETVVQLFPNPSNGKVTLSLSTVPVNTYFVIYDLQGKLIKELELTDRLNSLDLHLDKGFYLYRVIKDGVLIKKDKLIID